MSENNNGEIPETDDGEVKLFNKALTNVDKYV